jgi:ABC-type Fe3+-hydroxamate transport system substrate-binding protein
MIMEFKDQLNRIITLPNTPKRIVSLVPSQTELLVDLGLKSRLVGVTKFCIHPNDARKKSTIVGGTKNLNIEKIKSLNPDIIIANKEENDLQQIEECARHFPVWISDIKDLNDSIQMIKDIGSITKTYDKAEQITKDILNSFSS